MPTHKIPGRASLNSPSDAIKNYLRDKALGRSEGFPEMFN